MKANGATTAGTCSKHGCFLPQAIHFFTYGLGKNGLDGVAVRRHFEVDSWKEKKCPAVWCRVACVWPISVRLSMEVWLKLAARCG